MTSARKIRANCANARASTGPRTACSKARAAQNSWRHGLSVRGVVNPIFYKEIENLAREILEQGGPVVIDLAFNIAEAEIDLRRVRQARLDLFARHKLLATVAELTRQSMLLDRYERRALSRRKFAIREFDAARQQCGMK